MALSAAQMAQMSALLEEALELDPEGRRRWLEALLPEHRDLEPALRQALLPEESQATGTDRLGTLPKIDAGDRTAPASGLEPGARVGPYQLVRPLGAGGMAEVWLAQRADGAFKREVALKLPMLSRMRKDLASRFAHERDILAALEHVTIARFYDAGVSPDGLPYLAMEYVPGEPLTAWCNAHRLGLRERLKLFLQVLDAVQYAHGHHVIHRDLKPSNILVTESGQVRLLDFGVSKLLAEPDEHTQLTQLYGRALTPDYASPELVRGEAVDAASDIYSLGVVLYELLAGSRPYQIKRCGSAAQLEQAIATARIERPSTQLASEAGPARGMTQHKLARRLRGDLDAIVLKALSGDPQRRYATASALADDLQRHLSGEPVEARPDSLLYRAGKFVLRHRTGAATAAVASLAVVAAIGLMQSRAPTYRPPAFSVAVLSFTPPGGTLADQQLADLVVQAITNALGRAMHYATIVSHPLAAAEAGKPIDTRAIGREGKVRYLLEGEVHVDSDRVSVTAKLVDAESATQLWSDQFDAARSKWVADSSEASWPLISGLRGALWGAEEQRVAHGPGGNASVWDLVLRGEILERNQSLEGMLEARKLYDEALRLDPTFTAALVDRAMINYRIWEDDPSADRLQLAQEMDEFTHRALAIDKGDAYAWVVRGAALQMQWRWDAALEANAQATRLEPWSATNVIARSWILDLSGHADEALTLLDKAIAREPSAALLRFMRDNQCYAHLLLGQFDKAIGSCEKSVAVGNDWWPYMFLTAAYAQTGDMTRAAASKAELLRRRPGFSIARFKALGLSDSPVYLQQSETNFIPGLRKAGIAEQ